MRLFLFAVVLTTIMSCKVTDKTYNITGLPIEWVYPSDYEIEKYNNGFTLTNEKEFPVRAEIFVFSEDQTHEMMKYYNDEKLAYKGFQLHSVEFEESSKKWLGEGWKFEHAEAHQQFGSTTLRFSQYILLGRKGNMLMSVSVLGTNPDKTKRLLDKLYESYLTTPSEN